MRWGLSALFVLHGVAHLVGFVAPWRLAETDDVPYETTVLGGTIDLGDRGIRLVGVLWLTAALAFVAAAVALLNLSDWWRPLTYSATALSVVLTTIEWPESRIGLLVNAIIVAALIGGARLEWLPPAP